MIRPNEYQDFCKTTAIYDQKVLENFPNTDKELMKYIRLSYVALGMGEAGEIQGKIKKILRDCGGIITEEHKKAIAKEIGDLLYYSAQMCTELEITLEDVMEENRLKLLSRKERGVLQGSGDNR